MLSVEVEELEQGDPERVVAANAKMKAEAGWAAAVGSAEGLGGLSTTDRPGPDQPGPPIAVIGADTEVAIDGEVLGKPVDGGQAAEYLERLSGREHQVIGGVAVRIGEPGGEPSSRSGGELTRVAFRDLSPAEIEAYVASGEWEGKAGGYAVQGLGSMFVESIHGDLSNVIGLPIPLLRGLLPEIL